MGYRRKNACCVVIQVDHVFYTVVSDTPYNQLFNHIIYNKAVGLWGARVSPFHALFPKLIIKSIRNSFLFSIKQNHTLSIVVNGDSSVTILFDYAP